MHIFVEGWMHVIGALLIIFIVEYLRRHPKCSLRLKHVLDEVIHYCHAIILLCVGLLSFWPHEQVARLATGG